MNELGLGGRSLWDEITADYELDAAQKVQLLEACRIKDRCDTLDALVREYPTNTPMIKAANDAANQMKQLLAALRLPDASGKRAQYRGPRGAQAPTVPGGRGAVSSIERARARKGA